MFSEDCTSKKRPQGKLVWVNYGSVLDVAVDIRHGSDTFGMYHSEILSSENKSKCGYLQALLMDS